MDEDSRDEEDRENDELDRIEELISPHYCTTYCIHPFQYTWKYYTQNSVVRIPFQITFSQDWHACFM